MNSYVAQLVEAIKRSSSKVGFQASFHVLSPPPSHSRVSPPQSDAASQTLLHWIHRCLASCEPEEAFYTQTRFLSGTLQQLLLLFISHNFLRLHFLLPAELPLHPRIPPLLHPGGWCYSITACISGVHLSLIPSSSLFVGGRSHQQNPSGVPEEEKCEPDDVLSAAALY